MRPLPKLWLSIFGGLVLVITLVVYIYLQSRDYILGPKIYVRYPPENASVFGPSVEIRGETKRINSISLNEKPIFVNSEGKFKEKLLLPDGYNIIKFEAKDRFGKRTEKLLEFTVTSTPVKIIQE